MDEFAQAIEELYRRRYVRFRNAVATITGNYESARDAVQEGFARAFQKREDFRGEGSLEAWVWIIVLRTALEQRVEHEVSSLNGSFDAALVDPAEDPELSEALKQLPPRRRLIVFLRYFADLSYAEIARISGVSEGTVAATLAQARAALGEALVQRGGIA